VNQAELLKEIFELSDRLFDVETKLARLERLPTESTSRRCLVCNGIGSIPGFFLGTVKTCTSCHGKGRL
jgi:DnaJ-class molecular chaperone